MLRTASRVDANQPAIVAALRAIGATILHTHQLKNCFDLLVGYRGRTFLLEIKDPAQPASKRRLTPGEAKFRAEWRGSPYHVVHTIDEAIHILTALIFCKLLPTMKNNLYRMPQIQYLRQHYADLPPAHIA